VSVVSCLRPWLKVSAADQHPLAAARFSEEPGTIRIFNPVPLPWLATYMANPSRLHTPSLSNVACK
jgi:hypothetical protein